MNNLPETYQPYANEQDLVNYSMSQNQFDRVQKTCPNSIQPMLNAASAFANGYLSSQYRLPFLKIAPDLAMNVSHIAAFYLLVKIGFNPNSPEDMLVKARYDLAESWLMNINNDIIHPVWIDTPEDAQNEFVITSPSRGYNNVGTRNGVFPSDVS